MKQRHGMICTLFFALAIASPLPQNRLAYAATTPEWSKKMQNLYQVLASLLTEASSDQRFNNPANFSKIEADTKKLVALSHSLTQSKMKAPDSDPTLQMLSGLFSQEANRALVELKRGHRPYARSLLQSISGYCIACHTRNPSGPNFKSLPFEPAPGLTDGFEKGEFYAASRQFERAESEFSKVIQDHHFANAKPLAWERAVHHALNITVRINQSPTQAMEVVQAVLDEKNAPSFLKQNAVIWKKTLEEWLAEPTRSAKTEEGLYSEATRLTAKAHELQKYPMDRSADILYLRASAVLHDLLQFAPNGARAPEALLLIGVCYQVLSPLRMDDIHEIYYAACIEKSPHTPVSEICFSRYQESVHAGFTGSSGSDLPSDLKTELTRLEKLAQPNEINSSSEKAKP